MKISRYLVKADGLVDRFLQSCVIVYSTRTSRSLILRTNLWNNIVNGIWDAIDPKVLSALVDAQILIQQNENELDFILAQNRAAIEDDEVLYLVVQPTRSCQLGCGYCGQSHTSKKMSSESAENAVAFARSRLAQAKGRYHQLRVCWFGAEPLLGIKEIRSLTTRFQQLAIENAIAYSAKIVTNGLLLSSALASELVDKLSIDHIEITLDGLAHTHDSRRQTKKGLPSFSEIYGNVSQVSRLGLPVDISIRCNTDDSNRTSALKLIEKLASDGLSSRIRFYVAPIHSWGNDAHLKATEAEEFARFELLVLDHLSANGFEVSYIPGRKKIVCMAVRTDSRLFDAEGGAYNCTEVSYVPKYGSRNVYEIYPDGRTPQPAAQIAMFNQNVQDAKYDCNECRMLPVCGGSCPKQWAEGLEPCPPTKRNIEGRLVRANAALVSVAEDWY